MYDIIFYGLFLTTIVFALGLLLSSNPIYSALFLVLVMANVAGIFVMLDAFFIAGVQLIVYAGAVMVLFVMVLMLFDLKKDRTSFSQGKIAGFFKLGSAGLMLGLYAGAVTSTPYLHGHVSSGMLDAADLSTTRGVAKLLFTKYLFGFEVISILLLVVIVGAVSLARMKGGTHAQP